MGVYIFESRECPWIKIGHHKLSLKRPNVYYRVAGRGFHSCRHPLELENRLDMDNFNLVAWYPTLTVKDEKSIHKKCRTTESCGEFHPKSCLPFAIVECSTRGEHQNVSHTDKMNAILWAGKR